MDVKLDSDEVAVLKILLSEVVIKNRSGELGIMHGANRFVSTNRPLRKAGLEALDSVYKKVGLKGGCRKFDG